MKYFLNQTNNRKYLPQNLFTKNESIKVFNARDIDRSSYRLF